jgi:hypothetical protein
MFIARVLSKGNDGQSYTSILLRESYRVGSKVKSRTLAVLTKLPAYLIDVIGRALKQASADSLQTVADQSLGSLQLRTAESFGAVWVATQITERVGINPALGVTQQAQLALWQVVARVLRPGISILGMVRLATTCAAAAVLRWNQPFTEDHLYRNGAWLEGRHAIIEKRLWEAAPRQREQLYLYDVTSSYLEGEHNALGDWGYCRDGKKGKQQVVVGMLTDGQGDPCAVKVYPGNTSDLNTFADQVHKLRKSFGCQGVTLVGDRGMIRSQQMEQALAAGFHYITALTKPQIDALLRKGTFQIELFEEQVTEVVGVDDRRYILRRNPVRAQEIDASRSSKAQAMASRLDKANEYLRQHPRAKVQTRQRALEAKIKRLGVEGWLSVKAEQRQLSLEANAAARLEESRLDGCYVIHTDLPKQAAAAQTVHDRYKDLALVERDFRTMKTGHLEFRPWFVVTEDNTHAHALTSMLALKVRRLLEQAWQKLDITVEEGLRELERLNVMELIATDSKAVVARVLPQPTHLQQQLLDALKIKLPEKVPTAKVTVGTRVKLPDRRKKPKNKW